MEHGDSEKEVGGGHDVERFWISSYSYALTRLKGGGTLHLHVRNMEDVQMEKPEKHQSGSTSIRKLLYAAELLTQAYQVKLETLMTMPLFLERMLFASRERALSERLTVIGTDVYHHVQRLHQLLLRFGGHPGEDLNPCVRPEPSDPIAAAYFQEELFCQIAAELLAVLKGWADSDLHRRAEAQLTMLISESKAHLAVIDESCTQTERRYRDVVLERFRVTALP